MKKIIYILFSIDKALEFEWVAAMLDKSKFDLSFISIHSTPNTAFSVFCKSKSITFYHIPYTSKKDIPYAILSTYNILRREKPQIVHAHIFEGGLIGITAAWLAGIKHRIYTRHYSNYHHKYAPSGLKYDHWINKRATHIISITQLVSDILIQKENVAAEKITLIHHGFPFEQFQNIEQERVVAIKHKHQIPTDKIVIGVVSRYTFWKGVQYIIPAFKSFHEEYPNTHLVLANAKGDYAKEIKGMLATLKSNSYTEILFEEDNSALFKSFDVFVHVPVDEASEAFGQIYIEALLCGIPSIFTKSGIGNEVAVHEANCLVVGYEDDLAICEALHTLMKDEKLSMELTLTAPTTVSGFTIEEKVRKLEIIYTKYTNIN